MKIRIEKRFSYILTPFYGKTEDTYKWREGGRERERETYVN